MNEPFNTKSTQSPHHAIPCHSLVHLLSLTTRTFAILRRSATKIRSEMQCSTRRAQKTCHLNDGTSLLTKGDRSKTQAIAHVLQLHLIFKSRRN